MREWGGIHVMGSVIDSIFIGIKILYNPMHSPYLSHSNFLILLILTIGYHSPYHWNHILACQKNHGISRIYIQTFIWPHRAMEVNILKLKRDMEDYIRE